MNRVDPYMMQSALMHVGAFGRRPRPCASLRPKVEKMGAQCIVMLKDGGSHPLDNIETDCVSCHNMEVQACRGSIVPAY